MRTVKPFETQEAPVPMTDDKFIEILTRVDERVERIAQDVEAITHAVFGNGSPGLKTEVAVLKNEVTDLKVAAAERRVPRSVWVGGALSVLAALLVSPIVCHLLGIHT